MTNIFVSKELKGMVNSKVSESQYSFIPPTPIVRPISSDLPFLITKIDISNQNLGSPSASPIVHASPSVTTTESQNLYDFSLRSSPSGVSRLSNIQSHLCPNVAPLHHQLLVDSPSPLLFPKVDSPKPLLITDLADHQSKSDEMNESLFTTSQPRKLQQHKQKRFIIRKIDLTNSQTTGIEDQQLLCQIQQQLNHQQRQDLSTLSRVPTPRYINTTSSTSSSSMVYFTWNCSSALAVQPIDNSSIKIWKEYSKIETSNYEPVYCSATSTSNSKFDTIFKELIQEEVKTKYISLMERNGVITESSISVSQRIYQGVGSDGVTPIQFRKVKQFYSRSSNNVDANLIFYHLLLYVHNDQFMEGIKFIKVGSSPSNPLTKHFEKISLIQNQRL